MLVMRSRETQRVALVGACVNLVLAIVKIVVGLFAHSQALFADGLHSLSDLLTDALVWFAARRTGYVPNKSYPYGHGRFETAATLGLSMMLILVAVVIIWQAAQRLLTGGAIEIPEIVALYAALFSILANEALYWCTRFKAQRTRSNMLLANAWHHRSDAISSVVVLIGIGGSLLGWGYLDAVAAVVVAIMIAKVGWSLGVSAMTELMDRGLEDKKVRQIKAITQSIDGIRSLHMLRTRKIGHEALVDIHILVQPWLSVSEGHMISMAVEEQIKRSIEEINDVTVHVDPEDDQEAPPCEGLPLRKEVLAQLEQAWSDTPCMQQQKRILLHYLSGKIDIEVFFPFAYFKGSQQATELRDQLQARLKPIKYFGRVEVHFSV